MFLLKNQSIRFFYLLVLISTYACQKHPAPHLTPIEEALLHQSDSFFYIDTQSYPQKDKSLPIGVFDSGTGGLTVLDAIINFDQYLNKNHTYHPGGDSQPDFQAEYFIYLGDQANMPYGNYSLENNLPLLLEHIIKDVQFLLGNKYYPHAGSSTFREDKDAVKAIVIACNTATAYGKDKIEQFLDRAGLDIRVIGVIDAGVRAALSYFEPSENGSIAVMATAGTVSSNGYVHALREQIKPDGYTGTMDIFQQAGIGLAGAIDGSSEFIDPAAPQPRTDYRGPSVSHSRAKLDTTILPRYGFDWRKGRMLHNGEADQPKNIQINSIENYIRYHLVSLLEQIRQSGSVHPLKAIILGCTHYPFYMDEFREILHNLYEYREEGQYIYRPFMHWPVHFIDPAENTARELYEYLLAYELFNSTDLIHSEFYISVPNRDNPGVQVDAAGNFTYEYKYGRRAGIVQEYVKRVPLGSPAISEDVLSRLQTSIPQTYRLIEEYNRSNVKLKSN